MHAPTSSRPATRKSRKAFWLKQLHMWHWMSSAVSLIGLLLFAITGFTLNHAADIEGTPVVTQQSAQLPPALLTRLKAAVPDAEKAPLPADIAAWVEQSFPVKASADAEWSADEVYLPAPRPGGDAWVVIDLATGEASSEVTGRGWISYLNDLHKGRNSGGEWSLFIDIFAFACLVFAITGLFLLQLHSAKRRSTWPLVGLGLAIPAVIAIIFIH
ncbi:MAG: PepSY-associated TM helix domain-containing protein [Sphingopyxis sp.]|uniref:PepSY-associated TM helix domain-containing protein n=1 Tax=Sphingopyxis sp. TaxID=1908224 RepID=UPI001A2165EF|nr:PepSY-associated TM helix domain-containing protein [Sphingopyxis sp.]MBJ7499080.1 PepSY-associated TM helix domain-containing protein [Sphingopyxis sp.]